MGFLPAFFYFHQHKLTRLRGASLPSSVCRHQRAARGDDGKIELLWTVAAELVALKADVIVARRELSRRTVGTCQHNGVAIGIVQPAFPVVRPTAAGRWVAVARQEDVRLHLHGTSHRGIEIVHLEPEQDAIALGLVRWIADPTVVVFDIEPMQLQDQNVLRDQPLVFRSAVPAVAAQQSLIPAAARLDVTHCNKRLWAHPGVVATRSGSDNRVAPTSFGSAE